MKQLFKIATLTAALTFAAGSAQASEKIAYVDPNYLMQNHPLLTDPNSEFAKAAKTIQAQISEEEKKITDAEKKLADDVKKYREEEKAFADDMKKKIEALEKEAPKLRRAAIKKRQDAINAEVQAFQKKIEPLQKREKELLANVETFQKRVAEVQRGLDEQRLKIQQTLVADVRKVITETAKAKGFTLVLDASSVLYTESMNNEFTQDVLKALPKPPVAQPTPVTQPAAQPTSTQPAAK